MEILEIAIASEGGVGSLAKTLGLRQSAVSNWRARGVPRPWEMVLRSKYGIQLKHNTPTKEPAHG